MDAKLWISMDVSTNLRCTPYGETVRTGVLVYCIQMQNTYVRTRFLNDDLETIAHDERLFRLRFSVGHRNKNRREHLLH